MLLAQTQEPTISAPGLRVVSAGGYPFARPMTQVEFVGGDPREPFFAAQDGRVIHGAGRDARTVLDLNVDFGVTGEVESGLLGMALHPDFTRNGYVYLYYNLSSIPGRDAPGWGGNQLSRFTWNGTTLGDERVLHSFGAPGDGSGARPGHFGGPIQFGPDRKLYGVVGNSSTPAAENNRLDQAGVSSKMGGIYRLNAPGDDTDGSIPADNPFASNPNPDFRPWYGYGLRNSFGLAFDPVTARLWDTENGTTEYDEVNQVGPGFNGGWNRLLGPAARNPGAVQDLVNLPGSRYTDPAFSFKAEIAPIDLVFLADTALDAAYHDGVLVAGIGGGSIYLLRLNDARDGFALTGGLSDAVADNNAELASLRIGQGFGIVTDMEVAADGSVYVFNNAGRMYQIVPEPSAVALLLPLALLAPCRRPRARTLANGDAI
jgi:glucose/arabinose dehydrogenase